MKPLTILRRLIGQVRSMTGWMVLAILLGVAGFLAAILIPVLAGMALIEGGPALLWIMGLCAVLCCGGCSGMANRPATIT